MARVCSLTGKKGLTGNSVSHSNRKTKRVQQPNLITKRLFVPELNRTIRVKISTSALRTLNRKGVVEMLKEQAAKR